MVARLGRVKERRQAPIPPIPTRSAARVWGGVAALPACPAPRPRPASGSGPAAPPGLAAVKRRLYRGAGPARLRPPALRVVTAAGRRAPRQESSCPREKSTPPARAWPDPGGLSPAPWGPRARARPQRLAAALLATQVHTFSAPPPTGPSTPPRYPASAVAPAPARDVRRDRNASAHGAGVGV